MKERLSLSHPDHSEIRNQGEPADWMTMTFEKQHQEANSGAIWTSFRPRLQWAL
jgi:hypothetical protein